MTENTSAVSEVEKQKELTSDITRALEETHLLAEEEAGHKVFVGNLSFQTTEEELESFFSGAGKVLKANIITRGTRSLGYGFVSFESDKDAEEAVKELNKKELAGREINVEIAKPKEAHSTHVHTHSQRDRGRGSRSRGNRESRRRFSKGEPISGENEPEGQVQAHRNEGSSEDRSEEVGYSQTSDNSAHEHYHGRGRGSGPMRGRRFSRGRGGLSSHSHLGEPSKTTVFVSNLPYSFGNVELKNLFQGYNIVSSHVAYMKSGRSKGFGFVEFADEAEQQRALTNSGNLRADDREIVVKAARSETHSDILRSEEQNQEQSQPVIPAHSSSNE